MIWKKKYFNDFIETYIRNRIRIFQFEYLTRLLVGHERHFSFQRGRAIGKIEKKNHISDQ